MARAGYTLLVNKYYLDHLYTDVIVGGIKGPIAKAAYWINQNVHRRRRQRRRRRRRAGAASFVYDKIDQGVVDGIVNGSGAAAEGCGQLLRRIQTGQVQQYAALLFGGAVVLAGIFIVVI